MLPLPFVDIAAGTAVHLLMVRAIAAEYGVAFSRAAAQAAIASAVGGEAARWFGHGVGRSALKALPGVGSLAAMAAMPASAGSATYLLGRIFIAHFESGGALHDLDAAAAETHSRALKNDAA